MTSRSILAVAVLILTAFVFPHQPASCEPDFASGQILVKFKPGTPASAIAELHRRNASRAIDHIPQLGVQIVTTARGQEMAQARRYAANPNVEFAELDYIAEVMDIIPNDPAFQNAQWGLKCIQAPAAWEISKGSESVVIAIVDTGVDYMHPDLAARVIQGYDFYNNDRDAMDDNGHGTHLAGVLGAVTNNGVGVAGVTWRNLILPVKVYNSTGQSTYSLIAKGITYATDQSAKVINLSLGGTSGNSTLKNAVDYAVARGVVLAAAAGNYGTPGVCYPAAYPNVLAVGASDGWDQRSSASSYGAGLDVLAPDLAMSTSHWVAYGTMAGTSVSTAYVSGMCGLILSVDPSLTPWEVMRIVRDTADDIAPSGWDQYSGHGRINAYKGLRLASQATDSLDVDSTAPVVGLVQPISGATLAGAVWLASEVADDVGVVKVEYYVDGAVVASTASQPFEAQWNTSGVGNGPKMLKAKAYDSAGNCGVSEAVTVTVNNPIVTNYIFSGSVGAGGVSYHSTTLSTPASLSATMSWNKGNLDMEVADASGVVVASSRTTTQPEAISVGSLSAGQYRFKVIGVSGKARYTLSATTISQ